MSYSSSSSSSPPPPSSSPSTPSSSFDLEAGFSGCAPPCLVYSPPPSAGKKMGGRTTQRPRLFFCDDLDDDGPRHFLDSCFRCKRHLSGNRDIFMYRGDTPFCSEECRQEQIEMDEESERNWKMSRKEHQHQKQQNAKAGGGSSPKSDKIHVRATGTVVAG